MNYKRESRVEKSSSGGSSRGNWRCRRRSWPAGWIGWEKRRHSGSVTRLDAVVACDTHPTFLVTSCHHFLRGSMRAVSSLGQTWQRKKVFLWECRASLFLVSRLNLFHALKVRACSATSFGKSLRAILSEDGLWRVERYFRAGVIFSCALRFVDVRYLWFSFFFFFWKVICEGEKMLGKIF